MAGVPKSVKAQPVDWARWARAADRAGLSRNAWCVRAMTRVAETEEALARQEEKRSVV